MAVAEVEIFTRNFHADAAGRGRRPSGAPAPAGAQPRDCVCGGPLALSAGVDLPGGRSLSSAPFPT